MMDVCHTCVQTPRTHNARANANANPALRWMMVHPFITSGGLWAMSVTEEAVPMGGESHVGNLVPSSSLCCEPNASLKLVLKK